MRPVLLHNSAKAFKPKAVLLAVGWLQLVAFYLLSEAASAPAASAGQDTGLSGAAGATAVRANDFLNSIGVNSAVSRRGESLEHTIGVAGYLGVRWFRVGYESGIPVPDLIQLHQQTGARFSYGLMSGGTNIPRLLEGARKLASVGALLALEGNNEPNNWGVTYQGARGGRTNTWLPIATLQRDLYRAVKEDPLLKDYPVWKSTVSLVLSNHPMVIEIR